MEFFVYNMDYSIENRKEIFAYPIPDDWSDGDIRVLSSGYPDSMKPELAKQPFGSSEYVFMHFFTPVKIGYKGEIRDYPANTFIVWEPGSLHTYGNPEQPWCHCWIHCIGKKLEQLLNRSKIPLNTPIVLPDETLAKEYIGKIHQELKSTGTQDEEVVSAYMTLYIKMLERQLFPDRLASPYSGQVLHAIRFMGENRYRPLQLAEIARAVNLSVPRFSVRFREETGKSPMVYLLEERLNYSRTLFYDRDLTIGEIAERSGFNDPLYFSRQFHRHFGASPTVFRKKLFEVLAKPSVKVSAPDEKDV